MLKQIKNTVQLDIIISLVFMGGVSFLITINPEKNILVSIFIFSFITSNMGSIFLSLLSVLFLSLSKFGNIRLGEGKPDYSTKSWIMMIISAGIGLLQFIEHIQNGLYTIYSLLII